MITECMSTDCANYCDTRANDGARYCEACLIPNARRTGHGEYVVTYADGSFVTKCVPSRDALTVRALMRGL